MDKYSKIIYQFITIPVGVFCILAGLGLIGVSVWVSTFSDVASLILLPSIFGGGAIINFGVGYAFLGDEYKATHIVRDGRTTFTPVTTPKFLKRRKIVTFIGSISYIVLAVTYVLRTILVSVYKGYLDSIYYNSSVVALIIFAVLSLVLAFLLFMLYKKTKHVDLSEN